jgi:hypothetical protein
MIYRKVSNGEVTEDKLLAWIMVSLTVAGIFFIAAFARYQFTHLWRRPQKRIRRG